MSILIGLGHGNSDNMSIEKLDLSVRAYNCLKRQGIATIDQLLRLTKEELLAIRNLRERDYEEIREQLIARGYMRREDPQGPFAL